MSRPRLLLRQHAGGLAVPKHTHTRQEETGVRGVDGQRTTNVPIDMRVHVCVTARVVYTHTHMHAQHSSLALLRALLLRIRIRRERIRVAAASFTARQR